MRFLLIVIAALAISACSTPPYNYTPDLEVFDRPPVGETVTVSVGDEMLSQGVLATRAGIRVPTQVVVSGYTLAGGFYPQIGAEGAYTFHSFQRNQEYSEVRGGLKEGRFADQAVSIRASRGGTEICVITVFHVPVCRGREYYHTDRTVEHPESFQQTLIYNGRIGDEIHIAYREFLNSMARSAFSKTVSYDLRTSNEIGYQNARIEILDATNTEITYRVISNFREN